MAAGLVFAGALLLIALALMAGGGVLLWLGGSVYYLVAGVMVLASAIALFRRMPRSAAIYGCLLAGTLIWSVWEVGLDGWSLAPRLLGPAIVGLLFQLPSIRRCIPAARGWILLPVSAITLVMLTAVTFAVGPDLFAKYARGVDPIVAPTTKEAVDWRHWGGTPGGSRFVASSQINTGNVRQLRLAWAYDSHRPEQAIPSFEATPLAVDGRLYVCLQPGIVSAVDQDTGQEIWRFTDPDFARSDFSMLWGGKCRGVSYYEVPRAGVQCAKRILFASGGGLLMAIDAATGHRCTTFGNNGVVDLKAGMGEVTSATGAILALASSPPAIINGVAVIGQSVSDLLSLDAPSGVVRGYDAETGTLRWSWDAGRPDRTLLQPGEAYTRDTPNAWGAFSGDEQLGLVFVPTGNSLPDYFGGQRWPSAEAYSSAVVAIEVASGRVRWTFQTVHHDLWDYDVGAQPLVVDLPAAAGSAASQVSSGEQGPRPALLVPTKLGQIFVLDRRTGEPIDPVIEKPAPQGGVPEEKLAATQPATTGFPSLDGPPLREQDMWGLTPLDALGCRIRFKRSYYEGPFTPANTRDTIFYPGTAGGIDWGSVAVDAQRGLLAVNTLRFANLGRLVPRTQAGAAEGGKEGAVVFQMAGMPYIFEQSRFMSFLGVPCEPPPYGTMNVLDLNTRRLIWSRSLGVATHSGPFGLSSLLPIRMGVPNMGGSIVTAGGLAFIAAAQDRRLRAYDLKTGVELWHAELPSVAVATPMSYVSPKTGRQYIVVAAGGHYGIPGPASGSVYAFALPP